MSTLSFDDAHLTDFKAISTEADGSILIRGIAANYDMDRENEYFTEGAFSRGLEKFVSGPATLLFHHDMKAPIGRVLSAKAIPGVGIEVTARVDHQEIGSQWRHIYNGVKSRAISSFSFGGLFKRDGDKIVDVDVIELSVCGPSVGRGTEFSIIAGKALQNGNSMSKTDELDALRAQVKTMTKSLAEMKTSLPAGFTVVPKAPAAPGLQTFDGDVVNGGGARQGLSELERIQVEDAWKDRRTEILRKQNDAIRNAQENGGNYNPVPISVSAPDSFVREWRGDERIVREVIDGTPGAAPRREIPLTPEQALALDGAEPTKKPALLEQFRAALQGGAGTGSRLSPMANGTMAAIDDGAVTTVTPEGASRIVHRREKVTRALSPEEQFAAMAAETNNQTKDES